MTVTITERAATAEERAAGWTHAFSFSPAISPRMLDTAPLPADPMTVPQIRQIAGILGCTFVKGH